MMASGKSLVAVFWVVFLAGLVYVVVFQQVEEPEPVPFDGSVIGIGFIEMWDNYSRCVALFEEDIGEMSPDDFMDKVTNLKDNLDFEKLFGVSYEDLAKLRKEEQRAIIWGRTNEVEKMASEWSVITLDDVKSNLPDFKPRNFDGDADPDFDDLDSDNDGQIDAAESVDMQDKLIEELINEIMGGGISGMFDDTLDKIKLYKSSVSKMSDLYKYLNIDLYKSLFDQNNDGEQDWADTPVVNSGGNGSRPGGTGTQP